MTEREVLLFPLPEVVWFPGTEMQLYVFEPRYRSLITDAIEQQLSIAVSLLSPGWEEHADRAQPPVFEYCSMGTVEIAEHFSDGRYSVQLSAEHRVRIQSDVVSSKGYRRAKVVIDDITDDIAPALALEMRERLVRAIQKYMVEDVLSLAHVMRMMAQPRLVDMLYQVISAGKFDLEFKQYLLEINNAKQLYKEVYYLFKGLRSPKLNFNDRLEKFPYLYTSEN